MSFSRRNCPSGPGPPHDRGFTIALSHTPIGRTPQDKLSARRKELCLTTRSNHNRRTSMPPGGIRTHNPRKRAAADPRLRPLGHWVRLLEAFLYLKYFLKFSITKHANFRRKTWLQQITSQT